MELLDGYKTYLIILTGSVGLIWTLLKIYQLLKSLRKERKTDIDNELSIILPSAKEKAIYSKKNPSKKELEEHWKKFGVLAALFPLLFHKKAEAKSNEPQDNRKRRAFTGIIGTASLMSDFSSKNEQQSESVDNLPDYKTTMANFNTMMQDEPDWHDEEFLSFRKEMRKLVNDYPQEALEKNSCYRLLLPLARDIQVCGVARVMAGHLSFTSLVIRDLGSTEDLNVKCQNLIEKTKNFPYLLFEDERIEKRCESEQLDDENPGEVIKASMLSK